MKSNPITQRACTKYGSAPKNLEVTVDAAGTIPAKFEKMTPLKQLTRPGDDDVMSTGTGEKPLSDPISSDEKLEGGKTSDAVREIQKQQTGGFGDVFYPKSPFFGEGFDTGLDTSDNQTSSEPETLLDLNKKAVESQNRPIEVEMPEIDMTPIEKPKFISSGTGDLGDSGRFVGPYERRQRQRAVRKTARDRKRGAIKEAKLTGGDVSEARRQAKLAKARDIKAEAERMAKSNVDTYKTKFRGSGDPEAARTKFRSISTQAAEENQPLNFTRKYKSKAVGQKKANTPLFKMKGYGSNYKK